MHYIGLGCQSAVQAGLYKIRPSSPPGVSDIPLTCTTKILVSLHVPIFGRFKIANFLETLNLVPNFSCWIYSAYNYVIRTLFHQFFTSLMLMSMYINFITWQNCVHFPESRCLFMPTDGLSPPNHSGLGSNRYCTNLLPISHWVRAWDYCFTLLRTIDSFKTNCVFAGMFYMRRCFLVHTSVNAPSWHVKWQACVICCEFCS